MLDRNYKNFKQTIEKDRLKNERNFFLNKLKFDKINQSKGFFTKIPFFLNGFFSALNILQFQDV